MSKKILTALAPVAAIIAFAMVPAMAQATTLQAPAGTHLAVGAPFQAQSTNLVTQGPGGTELKCKSSVFHGAVTKNQATHAEATITKTVFDAAPAGCPTSTIGVTSDITTNASVAEPWKVQVQQPEDPKMEQETIHILPFTGKTIQFTSQVQMPQGTSIGTCNYKTASVQLMGQITSGVYKVEQPIFEVEAPNLTPAVCGPTGAKAELHGDVQIESNGNHVLVDMLP